ncbi:MAG TPA: DUF2127 domain-containing protein [Rhodocyclaceae bacterium]|nr:DUF2127 domain-containing protein [Rhodocyclaceae bacterium]
MIEHSDKQRRAVRLVALLEAFKGLLAIAAASGLLFLLHEDLAKFALRLVQHAHLNPAAHYPSIFINAATHLQDSRLLLLAFGAAAYSALRLIEAYGLFYEKAWAEVLAAASGAIYVPFELLGLHHKPDLLRAGLLLLNIVVVVFMLRLLWQRRSASDTD